MAKKIEQFTAGDEYICRGIVLGWERLEEGEFRQEFTYVSTVEEAKQKIRQAASDGWVLTLKAYGDLWFPLEEANKALDRQDAKRAKARASSENRKGPGMSLRLYRPVSGQSG